jgi:hypothetical protein
MADLALTTKRLADKTFSSGGDKRRCIVLLLFSAAFSLARITFAILATVFAGALVERKVQSLHLSPAAWKESKLGSFRVELFNWDGKGSQIEPFYERHGTRQRVRLLISLQE